MYTSAQCNKIIAWNANDTETKGYLSASLNRSLHSSYFCPLSSFNTAGFHAFMFSLKRPALLKTDEDDTVFFVIERMTSFFLISAFFCPHIHHILIVLINKTCFVALNMLKHLFNFSFWLKLPWCWAAPLMDWISYLTVVYTVINLWTCIIMQDSASFCLTCKHTDQYRLSTYI